MATSSTTFDERLTRLETGTVKLYAGDETPQAYKAGKLIATKQKAKKAYWTAIMIGGLFGALAGYMFKTKIGIEMFFSQPLLVVFSIVKADQMMAAICLAMIAGPICAIAFQMFSITKVRLSQFWWSYLVGSIAVNASTWYYFYLAMA
jgi:hypothetical protein